MAKPISRVCIDWDDDLFICQDAAPADALNRMHTGLSSDVHLVNLHWNFVNIFGTSAATVSFQQEFTDYGIRKLHCVTGTNLTAGAYFGWDNSGARDFTISINTTYRAVFWIKGTVGTGTGMTAQMTHATGSTTFTLTAEWQMVTFTFSHGSNTTQAFQITKTSSATNCTWDATGFMIVEGSATPAGFNAGHATNGYDNITADVKSAVYSLGKSSADQQSITDGNATLVLNNQNKRYSPEYSSSPLFGYMKPRLRMTIDIQDSSGTWSRRWTGWTNPIAPQPGETRDRRATITGLQGKANLDRIKFNQNITEDTTADEVIRRIILKGYLSAVTPLQCIMNRARMNAAYFVDPDAIMSLETGISTIPANAEDWDEKPASSVIDSLLTKDQGFCFIDRTGKVIYYNRHHYLDPALALTDTTITIGSEAVGFDYVYGQGYANTQRVNYHPPGTRTGIVWQSQAPIIMLGNSAVKEITAKFEYEEGRRMKVSAIAAFGAGGEDSTLTAVSGTVDVSAQVRCTVELKGGQAKLTLQNFSRRVVDITIILRGTIVESYGGQVAERVDADGVIGGQVLNTVNSKLIQTETEALNLADYLLEISKTNVGQFTHLQMVNASNTQLDKMLTLELGSKVTVSEGQTAHSSKSYYIVGMNEAWYADNLYNVTYQIAPIFRLPSVWILGTSILGTDTYLAY